MAETEQKYKTLIYEPGQVTRIIHNEPEKRNVLSGHFILEFSDALKKFQRNQEALVAVVLANGKIFCAGHDLGFVSRHDRFEPGESRHRTEEDWREQLNFMRDNLYYPLWDCHKPIVVGIQGGAYAGGVYFTLYCDIVVAAEGTVFGFEVNRVSGGGMAPAILPYFIGFRKTMEITLRGWNISASEAERLGLVNKVVPEEQLESEVMRYANAMALMPPEILILNKQAARYTQNRMGVRDAIWFGAETDIMAHTTRGEREKEFYKILKEQGMKAAIEFRDKPFEQFGYMRFPK